MLPSWLGWRQVVLAANRNGGMLRLIASRHDDDDDDDDDVFMSMVQPGDTATAPVDSGDQSTTSSDDFDPTTIIRQRRDASAFVGDGVDLASFRRRAAELGYSDDDDDVGDEDWESSEDEYIGLIPMLCARCVRNLRRHWFDQRAKHFLVVFNVIFCVRTYLFTN